MRHIFEVLLIFFSVASRAEAGKRRDRGCVPFSQLFDLQQALKDGTQRACKIDFFFWGYLFQLGFESLRREYVQGLNLWRGGEQIFGFGHERFGDLSVQVSLSAFFGREGVKDSKGRCPNFEGKPRCGTRFALCYG
jgi:hypothetical protein